MDILSWIVLGLLAGVLANFIMPGKGSGGWIITILLGIAGAFVGGWVGGFFGIGTVGGFSLGSIATATGGAVLLLFIQRMIK